METFFTKNSDLEKKLKPKLESIVGSAYKIKGSGYDKEKNNHPQDSNSISIKCSISIDQNVDLRIARNEILVEKNDNIIIIKRLN